MPVWLAQGTTGQMKREDVEWEASPHTGARSTRPCAKWNEDCLASATVPGKCDHNVHYLPPYQVGSCAADARQRIEQAARRYGYEAIIWDPVFPAPEHLP